MMVSPVQMKLLPGAFPCTCRMLLPLKCPPRQCMVAVDVTAVDSPENHLTRLWGSSRISHCLSASWMITCKAESCSRCQDEWFACEVEGKAVHAAYCRCGSASATAWRPHGESLARGALAAALLPRNAD